MKKLSQICAGFLAIVVCGFCAEAIAQELESEEMARESKVLAEELEGLEHGLEGLEVGLEGMEMNLKNLSPGLKSLDLHFEGFEAFDAFEVYDVFEIFEADGHFGYFGDHESGLTDDEILRMQTLRALIQSDGDATLPLLREQFDKEENPHVRKHLVGLIASLETDESVELISAIATDDADSSVRKRAVYYLGRSGSKKAVAVLREILSE